MAQLGKLREVIQNQGGAARQGVSVTVYREGAIVNGAQSGTSPLAVTVYHNGKIKASDSIFVNTSTSPAYTVSSLTGNTTITLSWAGGTTLSLLDGDVLVPSNSKPTLYSDDQATTTTANPLTSDATGTVTCWTEAGTVEMLLSGSGITSKLLHGEVIPTGTPAQVRWADDFAANSSTGGIQEAADDLPSAGGEVRCSGKTYSLSTSVWLHSGVKLIGAGVGQTILQRAAGSITNGSANNSGAVISLGPKGSNGTLFSSGTPGSNITISNLTMDGNQSTQSVTVTGPAPVGLRAVWVSGLYLDNVKIINTLQSAYYLANCADIHLSNISADTVGQWSTVSARNALDLHNNDNSTTNTNQGTVTNFYFKSVGDEGIAMSGVQGLAISNGSVDGHDFGIEFTSASTVAMKDCTFSNINFKNGIDFGITFNATVADASNISFNNLNFDFHSTLHETGVIYLSSSASSLSDIIFSNITASNVHVTDSASGRNWIDCQAGTSGKTRSRLFFNNIDLRGGATSSVRTVDNGVALRGPCSDMHFSHVRIKDVQGSGFFIDDSAADTINDITFNDCVVDGANYSGFRARNDTAAGTIKGICFNNCTARNVGKQAATTDAAGFVMHANFAGSSLNNIYFRGCRGFKTTGTSQLYGLTLVQAAGTLDEIYVDNCDFKGNQTAETTSSGTVTNIRCRGEYVGTSQQITAVGNTITLPSLVNNCTVRLTADNSYTLTSAPTLANGFFEGQIVRIINEDTVDTITIQDQGTLASSNLRLSANTIALAPRDNITLIWNGTIGDWVQLSTTNVL